MVRAIKGKVYVRPHRWKHGKSGRHPGYWRPERKLGKERILGKQYVMREVRDKNGLFKGWKRVKK